MTQNLPNQCHSCPNPSRRQQWQPPAHLYGEISKRIEDKETQSYFTISQMQVQERTNSREWLRDQAFEVFDVREELSVLTTRSLLLQKSWYTRARSEDGLPL